MKLFDNCIEGIELEAWEQFSVGDHLINLDATLPYIPGNFARGRLLRATLTTTPEKTFALRSQGQHEDSADRALVRLRLKELLGPNQIYRIVDTTMCSDVLISQPFFACKRPGSFGIHALIVLSPGASISFCDTIFDEPSEYQKALLQARGKELVNKSVLELRVCYDGDCVKILKYRHRLFRHNDVKSPSSAGVI